MSESSMPANVGSMEGLGVIERAEWQRRFAARIVQVCGWDAASAAASAKAAAEQNYENNGDEWLDPEDEADVEISYMEDDDGE